MSKIITNTYLNFDGNCREAMNYYQSVFGGKLEIMNFGDSPMEVPDSLKDQVMHATLVSDGLTLMASDNNTDQKVVFGSAYSIMVGVKEVEYGKEIFEKLAEGGMVLMPYDKTFWNAMFGMCIDKFGIQWMVDCELGEE